MTEMGFVWILLIALTAQHHGDAAYHTQHGRRWPIAYGGLWNLLLAILGTPLIALPIAPVLAFLLL